MAEVLARRTIYSKTFETGPNSYRCVIYNKPVHYHDGSAFQDIDLTPRAELDHYVFDKHRHVLRIGAGDLPIYRYTEPGGDLVEVELLATPYRYTVTGNEFEWQVTPTAYYTLKPTNQGVSSFIWLTSAESQRVWQWRVQGNPDLLQPIAGFDAQKRLLELIVSWAGDILTVEWTGRVTSSKKLRKAKKIVWADDPVYPVKIDPTVNRSPTAASDDVQSLWTNNGANYSYMTELGTELEAGIAGTATIHYAGMRFQNVTVPVGSTINAATLKLRGVGERFNVDLRIYGNAVDSADIWGSSNRVKNITKTSAFAPVTIDFNTGGDNTFNIKTIVEEIIGRTGWASGANMAFGVFRNGTYTSNGIWFAALEHASLAEPRLEIDYSTGGVVGPGAGLTRSILLRPRRLVN